VTEDQEEGQAQQLMKYTAHYEQNQFSPVTSFHHVMGIRAT